ncbi:zinc ribbon domain-containing protein [Desulfosporosinus sp. PR]|uniref:zinc ribbon domain-containing protein n=1 Tax=Candidatus Desulfosporosinus nitrosoreducens TaxID=3401928 RepID=UPI0027EDDC92|nr:zinc ribbon domain-containing protein [Desulfosporosinus sp. PR]MDQ7097107.1 zinc ribbon domain-containing protein [Desulfosporosinus sp. PR]
MPLYDFICSNCGASREVLLDYETKKHLELLCIHCGGVLRAAPVNSFTVITKGKVVPPKSQTMAKPCGHSHHCRCAAIKQRRPNPFQKQIDQALGKSEPL